ncbi:hypothetical protein MAC_09386 [Metarhizium acridum CQMa 102]|uniref:Uncharacterized protein n=1 Tax=Metarhizium acridum (strain CQMa 102) TaxID=655827 RepID=E9EHN8_METAQ|nr:uncharacterized protein MAC_09386 [Metarhizium acridum CQMa 102]EFY84572.1 hypothetical protein MAC_09386 [Metarhizium acridum CQMa 102]
MFEPTAEEGCRGCGFMAANLRNLLQLAQKDATVFLVSRAPVDKITAVKTKDFLGVQWVASYGSDFNYNHHVTLDENVTPVEYFKMKEELDASRQGHTYYSYFRLNERTGTIAWFDSTPAGRKEGPEGPVEFKLLSTI